MAGQKRKLNAAPVFILIAVLLITLIVILALSEANRSADAQKQQKQYEIEAAVTPTPSATVPNLRITQAPVNMTPDPVIRDPSAGAVTMTPVVLLSLTATPAAPETSDTVLVVGSKGDEVRSLQQRLKELGYYAGAVDGDFGTGTKNAVTWFQRQHGLSVDGAAGKATKTALYSDNAQIAYMTPTPAPIDVTADDIPMLVNREHPVTQDFVPADLVSLEETIPAGLCTYKIKGLKGVRTAVEALIRLLEAAHADGLTEWQFSEAYRTYDRQKQIFDNSVNGFMNENGYSRSRAVSATRQTVADPGTSEHHTGLAFDITVPGKYFVDTAQYRWMLKNCWDYGFILRYTDEKQKITGFLGEEWHFRYVGLEHAQRMKNSGLCLEEYIDLINRQ